jgi:hypothetical protein
VQNAKKWGCSECVPSKTPCKHLEELLPQMTDGDHPKYISDGAIAAMTMNIFQSVFWTFSTTKFLELMRNYGFTDAWDLELLEAKYCRNLSAADVAKEQNYVSKDKVKRRLKQLRELLRERGFEQELRSWQPNHES